MKNIKTVQTFWNEKWAKIDTISPTNQFDYYISNYGKIKSVNKINSNERLLKGSKLPRGGYRVLNIRLKGNNQQSIYIHKFVGEHFVPKGDDKREFVVHLDEDKGNNHWQNLKWMTRGELTKWQIDHGIFNPENKKRGSNTKLTETRVKMIKKWLNDGKTKKKVIAKKFGITEVHLKRIEKGQYWGYVELDGEGIKNK